MKKLIITLLAIYSISCLHAQTDTTFFDRNWQQTEKNQASFYRLPFVPKDEGFLLLDFFISGAKQFEGITISKDPLTYHGKAIWYYENGKFEQIANYEKGILQGEFISYDVQGNLIAKGIYKDGDHYDGSFATLKWNANQIDYYVTGKIEKTEIVDNKAGGKAKIVCLFSPGTQEYSEVSFYSQNGDLAGKIKTRENEPFDGTVIGYNFSPMVVSSIMEISEGKSKSPVTHYYANGLTKKTVYFEDNINYPYKEIYFTADGKIMDSLSLKDGVPIYGSKVDFFDTQESALADKIEKIEHYDNGELNGPSKKFFPNGKLLSEVNYANGIIEGDLVTCDSLGNVIRTLTYKDGEPWTGIYSEENDTKTYKEGVITEEKRFYPECKLFILSTTGGWQTVYDTGGNELARLLYKDGEPWEGKKLNLSYYSVESEESYSNGVKVKSIVYSEGKPGEVTEYNNEGNPVKISGYYSSGAVQRVTLYDKYGYENSALFYDTSGKQIGKLIIDKDGYSTGDKFIFNGDIIEEHSQIKTDRVVRTRTYNNGVLISDIQSDGISYFYDNENNKTYQCTYKNGEPFDGTRFDYSSLVSLITRLASYKNGLLDGEFTEFEGVPADNNPSGLSSWPSAILIYKNGEKEGLAKQFYMGKLIKTIIYSNDQANGESKTYDLDGNVESTLVYKDDNPVNGITYDYDYEHQLKSITSYNNGYPNGEQKYFEDGELVRIDSYDNGSILKKIVYRVGNEYELTYRDSKPFDGIRFESDTEYTSLEEYKNGVITARKSYRDLRSAILESSEIYDGDRCIKTACFKNGQKKEEITFVESGREGAATFYDRNGKEIAKGNYVSDLPLSGTFAFYSTDNEYDYLLLQVEKNNFLVTEYINGKPGKKMQYSNSENKELEVFLETLESVFEDYTIR